MLGSTKRFSKLNKSVALRRVTVVALASAIIAACVAWDGSSDRIQPYHGPQFMAICFMAIMKALGTEAVRTTAHNPQKNDHV